MDSPPAYTTPGLRFADGEWAARQCVTVFAVHNPPDLSHYPGGHRPAAGYGIVFPDGAAAFLDTRGGLRADHDAGRLLRDLLAGGRARVEQLDPSAAADQLGVRVFIVDRAVNPHGPVGVVAYGLATAAGVVHRWNSDAANTGYWPDLDRLQRVHCHRDSNTGEATTTVRWVVPVHNPVDLYALAHGDG